MRAIAIAVVLAGFSISARAKETDNEIRLYALDCGSMEIKNIGFFSDTGEYDGQAGSMVDPCFLIRHPKGDLLWDTGLGDDLSDEKKTNAAKMGVVLSVEHPLVDQLKALGLAPEGVAYVAFSHFHFDHTGNADLFESSTWLLNKAELEWALLPGNTLTDPSSFSTYETAKTQWIHGDFDVFGDGSVKILKAPGHTPGHQALMIKLKKAGTVILSGDLYHLRANREHARVPTFNTDRADTLASINRIETIVKNTKARFIIQHSPEDFKSLPKFPAYLD